jgi:3-hydroxyacyl-[acyl-carrier-protein] dehydratase
MTPVEHDSIRALLPWREPYLMIDRLVECALHERILTLKRVSHDEPLLCRGADRGTWLPAVLLLEGMSQSAALLYVLTYAGVVPSSLPLLGYFKASLRRSAAPGESVHFDVRSIKMTRAAGLFHAVARIGESCAAEAELAFAAAYPDPAGEGQEVR